MRLGGLSLVLTRCGSFMAMNEIAVAFCATFAGVCAHVAAVSSGVMSC